MRLTSPRFRVDRLSSLLGFSSTFNSWFCSSSFSIAFCSTVICLFFSSICFFEGFDARSSVRRLTHDFVHSVLITALFFSKWHLFLVKPPLDQSLHWSAWGWCASAWKQPLIFQQYGRQLFLSPINDVAVIIEAYVANWFTLKLKIYDIPGWEFYFLLELKKSTFLNRKMLPTNKYF